MKYKELKSMPLAEVRKMLTDLKNQEHELSVKIRLNQIKDTHKAKQVRKDIARIMTFLHPQKDQ
jgi:ribosomal protein L29